MHILLGSLISAVVAVVSHVIVVPTPAAELFDGAEVIGAAWPLVAVFMTLLAVPFALVYGKSIVGWAAGLVTRFAHR